MNKILNHLFLCAMEDQKNYLDRDEYRDYRTAMRAEEQLKDQLEQLLEGEPLRLFKQFMKNREEGESWSEASFFRIGLSMGLKLGAFYTSEY